MSESVAPHTAGLSRRTVMKGAAWSAPVVALSVAAPARAASVDTSTIVWAAPVSAIAGTQDDNVLRLLVPSSLTIGAGASDLDPALEYTFDVFPASGEVAPSIAVTVLGASKGMSVYPTDPNQMKFEFMEGIAAGDTATVYFAAKYLDSPAGPYLPTPTYRIYPSVPFHGHLSTEIGTISGDPSTPIIPEIPITTVA